MDASIIVSIISIIGSFLLIYLSTIKENFDKKYNVRKEQLDKFYIPFYQKYCAGFLSTNKLSRMDFETRVMFLDLMTKNLHLMEPKSQSFYQEYYSSFLTMLEAESGNEEFPLEDARQDIDYVFDHLSSIILKEYKHILMKCHLPVPYI